MNPLDDYLTKLCDKTMAIALQIAQEIPREIQKIPLSYCMPVLKGSALADMSLIVAGYVAASLIKATSKQCDDSIDDIKETFILRLSEALESSPL